MAQAKIRMMVGRKRGLASTPALNFQQASAATFVAGAPVKLASGKLTAPSTANGDGSSTTTYVKASSTANVIGISQGTAVASSDDRLVVAPIQEGMVFEGNLVHKTQSSAKVSKIGSTVYLGKDKSSDTHWGWSLSAPGASSASYINGTIVGLVDPASTVNGRVLVEIKKGGGLFV
jgi:hypothetical protein